jgi:hypothetical protein
VRNLTLFAKSILMACTASMLALALQSCGGQDESPSRHVSPKSADTPAQKAEKEKLKKQMAGLIQAKGLWCNRVTDIVPTIFGNSPNHNSFHVLCDDGDQAVNYSVTIYQTYYTVKE